MKVSTACDSCRVVHPLKELEFNTFDTMDLRDGWLISPFSVLCPNCNKVKR